MHRNQLCRILSALVVIGVFFMAAASTFCGARAVVAADRIRVSFASDSAVYGSHFIARLRKVITPQRVLIWKWLGPVVV